MRGTALIAICLCASAAVNAAGAGAAPAPPKECAAPLGAIKAVRDKLDAGRRVLSAEEADCAFLQFTTQALSARCATIKARATPKVRQTWGDMLQEWGALDRLRLDLRKLEDSLDVVCEPQ